MTKNNYWKNSDRYKIHEIFLIDCFVFVIIRVWQTVHSSAMTQITNYSKFNGENVATNCSMVTVLALDGLTKKHFGHYALLKFFPQKAIPGLKWSQLWRLVGQLKAFFRILSPLSPTGMRHYFPVTFSGLLYFWVPFFNQILYFWNWFCQ